MQAGCKQNFARDDVEACGTEEIWKKYLRFKENIQVDTNPNLRWCPKPSCMKYVQKAGRWTNTATCECGQEVCFRCGNAAHGNVRCANVGDAQLEDWIKK